MLGPDTITLRVCPVCGRNDLRMTLADKHYSGGTLCPGRVVKVTYVRARGEGK